MYRLEGWKKITHDPSQTTDREVVGSGWLHGGTRFYNVGHCLLRQGAHVGCTRRSVTTLFFACFTGACHFRWASRLVGGRDAWQRKKIYTSCPASKQEQGRKTACKVWTARQQSKLGLVQTTIAFLAPYHHHPFCSHTS